MWFSIRNILLPSIKYIKYKKKEIGKLNGIYINLQKKFGYTITKF